MVNRKFVGDVIITWDEIEGFLHDLLYTKSHPDGKTKLTEWARANAETLGIKYASELTRRNSTNKDYQE